MKKRFKSRKRYDILNPIDREDWRESMSQVVYAVVPKEFCIKLKELKKANIETKWEPFIEDGIFGKGAYFFIDNLDYAKHWANKTNGIVFEAKLEVKNTLNLLTSSVGQQQIQTLLKSSVTPHLQSDKNIFDILIEKSSKRYDSIMGICVDNTTQIMGCDMIYVYMSKIICVKDYSCIKGYRSIKSK